MTATANTAGTGRAMRFSVDPWDPTYGSALDGELEATTGDDVSLEVEMAAADWRPIAVVSGAPLPAVVLFVDGVRRVEAKVWIDESEN